MSGRIRLFSAVAIIVLGAVGYALFGSVSAVDGNRMARLVLPRPGLAHFNSKPFESTFEPPALSSSSVIKQAGVSQPDQTGVYQVAWRTGSPVSEAGLMVEFLPAAARARAAQTQLEDQYTNSKKLSAEELTLTGRFTVAGLPSAFARTYSQKSSSTTSASSAKLYLVVFQVNRVVVFELIDTAGSAINENAAGSIARAEVQLLDQREPGFVLTHQVRPIGRALLFALVTLALAGAIVFFPTVRRLISQRRERQEERARQRAQRHVRSRGAKSMQRRRAPAWQQRQTTGRRRSGR